jgi:hypothetical protein
VPQWYRGAAQFPSRRCIIPAQGTAPLSRRYRSPQPRRIAKASLGADFPTALYRTDTANC